MQGLKIQSGAAVAPWIVPPNRTTRREDNNAEVKYSNAKLKSSRVCPTKIFILMSELRKILSTHPD